MRACRTLLAIMLLQGSGSFASGWNDFSLEIAPGFLVYRMNSFDVCLGKADGNLLICPDMYPGVVGPLVEYAITKDLVGTRHLGVRPNDSNPTMPDGDPSKEYYFVVSRADYRVVGPLTRVAWEQKNLPSIASLQWVEPKNPNFWTPLIGAFTFLLFTLVIYAGPLVVVAVLVAGAMWLYRRRTRKGPDAA